MVNPTYRALSYKSMEAYLQIAYREPRHKLATAAERTVEKCLISNTNDDWLQADTPAVSLWSLETGLSCIDNSTPLSTNKLSVVDEEE